MNHTVVKQILEANEQRDRIRFTSLYKQIGSHLYAVGAMPQLRECNCIDCFCLAEELENDLILGVKSRK
jgi:hypothetical protein